jgi:regulator of replication initiation timing
MKSILLAILSCVVLIGSISCGKEVKGLKEEMKILKEENSFLKAENIVLKKELDEVYKKLEEREKARDALKTKTEISDPEKVKPAAAKPESKPKNGDNKVKNGDNKKPR